MGMADGSHKKYTSIVGENFGKLTVIDFAGMKNHKSYWLCKCVCGTEKVIRKDHLTCGKVMIKRIVTRLIESGVFENE